MLSKGRINLEQILTLLLHCAQTHSLKTHLRQLLATCCSFSENCIFFTFGVNLLCCVHSCEDRQLSWMFFLIKVIAGVFPAWHWVNTHLNAPNQQTSQKSACIEVQTLAVYQWIEYIVSTCTCVTLLLLSLFPIPVDTVREYLVFPTILP